MYPDRFAACTSWISSVLSKHYRVTIKTVDRMSFCTLHRRRACLLFNGDDIEQVTKEANNGSNWHNVSTELTNLCLSPGGLGDLMFTDLVSSIIGKVIAEECSSMLDSWLAGRVVLSADEVDLAESYTTTATTSTRRVRAKHKVHKQNN